MVTKVATNPNDATGNRPRLGMALSGLAALFFLFDGIAKLFKPAPVVEATVQLGIAESLILPLGLVLVLCTVLYLVPRTAILGAVLLTGYLGGAVATHVRTEQGAFPIVFPIVFGVLVWGGLWFRSPLLRELLPLRGGVSSV